MTLIQWLKTVARKGLQKRNQYLLFVPQSAASGFDLSRDLQLVLGTRSPVCLDIGANLGQTIDLIQQSFGDATIHSFEPSTATFRLLQARDLQGNVVLHNLALGRKHGTQDFINYERSDFSSFLQLADDRANRYRSLKIASKEQVEIVTVDGFVEEKGITVVDLLKTDTQGFDLEVLLGAAQTLRSGRIRNVLVELNFVRMYEGQASATGIIDLLEDNGLFLVDFYEKIRYQNTIGWCTALFSRRD